MANIEGRERVADIAVAEPGISRGSSKKISISPFFNGKNSPLFLPLEPEIVLKKLCHYLRSCTILPLKYVNYGL